MSHTVTLQPSGRTFNVESNETVLDAALRQGLALQYGCRGGACGACKGTIVEGAVHYDDDPMALSEDDVEDGMLLTCLALPDSDLVLEVDLVEEVSAIKVQELPAKIKLMERLGADVMRLGLTLPEDARLQYLAGQYVEFLMDDGGRRAFSIANAPHDDEMLEFHVRHVPGGKFTDSLFNEMEPGSLIRMEGPHGSFFVREDSERPMIMLATGTGFGPIKGIIEHMIAEESERPIYLYWGAENQDGLYMGELAQKWADEHAHIHFRPVFSGIAASGERKGYVQDAVVADFDSLADYEVYACGNPNMVKAAQEKLLTGGVSDDHFFSDSFDFATS